MPAISGYVLVAPSSVAKTGTSSVATIGTNGSVTFSACDTVSLNGVFTSAYDNYMVNVRLGAGNTASQNVILRLRASGSDASGTNYTWQWLQADNTTVSGLRTASATNTRVSLYSETGKRQGANFYVFGPQLAQPTAFRSFSAAGYLDAYLIDYASTHSLSTSYDGFSIFPESSGQIQGLISVYGVSQ